MERRKFLKTTASAGLVPGFAMTKTVQAQSIIVPKAIKPGDTLGVVTPASALSRSAFEQTISNIEKLGFKAKYSDNIRVRRGFLSGTDDQRILDMHQMFQDDEVKGIICARGGYGSARLLPMLDFQLIRSNPKVFLGYSDITALHQAIFSQSGVISYHGPVGASEFNDFTSDYFEDVLIKGRKVKIQASEPDEIYAGKATGVLAGGNLSLIASMVGTPYEESYKGKILVLEDIGESTYRIDRMLTQVKQSGILDGIKGIALGYFTNCDAKPDDPYYDMTIGLREVFVDQFNSLNVPVLGGLPIGHESHNCTFPIGISAELDTLKGRIKLLERPVS